MQWKGSHGRYSAIADLLKRATDAGDVPGVVAAAATAEGPNFAAGFGGRDTASRAAMAADTVVWIASMTKAMPLCSGRSDPR